MPHYVSYITFFLKNTNPNNNKKPSQNQEKKKPKHSHSRFGCIGLTGHTQVPSRKAVEESGDCYANSRTAKLEGAERSGEQQ